MPSSDLVHCQEVVSPRLVHTRLLVVFVHYHCGRDHSLHEVRACVVYGLGHLVRGVLEVGDHHNGLSWVEDLRGQKSYPQQLLQRTDTHADGWTVPADLAQILVGEVQGMERRDDV